MKALCFAILAMGLMISDGLYTLKLGRGYESAGVLAVAMLICLGLMVTMMAVEK